jgi:hypothetical protein
MKNYMRKTCEDREVYFPNITSPLNTPYSRKIRGAKIMKLVTVHLPDEFLHDLDELVRLKRYPNRSECIRVAIRDLLKEEMWNKTNAF